MMGSGEVKGLKYSRMETSIKGSGTEISRMEKELFGTKMVISILESGLTGKPTGRGFILLEMDPLIKEIG